MELFELTSTYEKIGNEFQLKIGPKNTSLKDKIEVCLVYDNEETLLNDIPQLILHYKEYLYNALIEKDSNLINVISL